MKQILFISDRIMAGAEIISSFESVKPGRHLNILAKDNPAQHFCLQLHSAGVRLHLSVCALPSDGGSVPADLRGKLWALVLGDKEMNSYVSVI